MKKPLILSALSSLVLNSTVNGTIFIEKILIDNKLNVNNSSDNDLTQRYAKETSIIPKALLVSKNKGFSTGSLLENMKNKLGDHDINFNFSNNIETANAFINDLTVDLNSSSIDNIQSNFQRNGKNQKSIDELQKELNRYNSYDSTLNKVSLYFDNSILSQITPMIENILKNLKSTNPEIVNSLASVKLIKFLPLIFNELNNDWDAQEKYGSTPFEAIKNYMASGKGDFTQAKSKDKWDSYVQGRAEDWTWVDFYEYIAGANLNYMFKILSDNYFGDLIANNITWNLIYPNGFNDANFLKQLESAFKELLVNSEKSEKAMECLIKALVPIIKIKVLKLENPILKLNRITWKETDEKNNFVLQTVLKEIENLLSDDGKVDFINLIASLLNGKFAEDILVYFGSLYGNYTVPHLFSLVNSPPLSWIVSDLNPEKLAGQLVDELRKKTDELYIGKTFDDILKFTDEYLTYNPIIDFKDFVLEINQIFNNSTFSDALDQIINIIVDPNSGQNKKLRTIFENLGMQKGKSTFKEDSILAIVHELLNNSSSVLSQILNIFRGTKENPGIVNNLIKKQEEALNEQYEQYFDINNEKYFEIPTNSISSGKERFQGKEVLKLSYTLIDKLNNKKYSVSFINQNSGNDIFQLKGFIMS